ncbi:putative arabinogalactan peptide, AGP [Tanacetum coccineum]
MMNSRSIVVAFIGFMFMAMFDVNHAQEFIAPSPGPSVGSSSDGAAIDQGIAYLLLLVALAITYLIH